MSWVKLDDRFTDNPKVSELSDRAFRVHVEGLCYVAGALTDGYISPKAAARWSRRSIGELVTAGLWNLDATSGYRIHDYLDYNPPKEKVIANRQAKAAAGARGGAATAAKKHGAGALVRPPSRPVPSPTTPPTGATADTNPNQPTHDQLYLGEKLDDPSLTPGAIVKLNKAHGRARVESAMREMHGFPPEERVRSVFAYVDAICKGES